MSRVVKICLLLLAIVCIASTAAVAGNIDLIVLLDTSESVFPIFDDLLEVIVEDTVTNHLQAGDYFHLISFNGAPQIEVSKQITTSEDMEDVFTHIFLLQPLGSYTDLLRALQYLYQYTVDLPEARKKYIVVLTDGIHDPPPDSPFAYGKRDIDKELKNITAQIGRKDWELRIVRLQGPDSADTGEKENFIDDISSDLETAVIEYPDDTDTDASNDSNEFLGNPSIEAPGDIGEIASTATIPIRVKNHDTAEKSVTLEGLYLGNKNILLNRPEAVIPPGGEAVLDAEIQMPEGMDTGSHTLRLRPEFDSDLRFSPPTIDVAVEFSPGKFRLPKDKSWKYIVLITALIAAVVLIVFFVRRMRLSLDTLFRRGSETVSAGSRQGSAIEMVVEGQNTQIGLRNVHTFSSNSKFCVGGDGSPFVIFLHPFPRCIGEISGNGDNLTFHPRKPSFFPDNSESSVTDCLRKKITAISDNGKRVCFYFRKYISPLERINRIMRLTAQPGLPEKDYNDSSA